MGKIAPPIDRPVARFVPFSWQGHVIVDVYYPRVGVPKLRELAVCRRACCDNALGPSQASRFARIYVIYSHFGTLALRRETALPLR
jgi:hypothetical protein